MPIEILEPDLARRIFVGANNPLMRTTIRNSPRVTLKPNGWHSFQKISTDFIDNAKSVFS